MMAGKVNWYQERVMLEVEGASDELLAAIAFQVEGQAKINITDNAQIDTGFMRASVYAASPGRSTFGQASSDAAGLTHSRRTGRAVDHAGDMGTEMRPEKHQALVVVGAVYAIYQEMRRSFLYRALEMVASRIDGARIRRF